MYCKKCRNEVNDNIDYCPKCGYPQRDDVCLKCNNHLGDDEVFCKQCGNKTRGLIVCPNCHESISDDSRYCKYCGTFVIKCPRCNNILSENDTFCPKCGTNAKTVVAHKPKNTYIRSVHKILLGVATIFFVSMLLISLLVSDVIAYVDSGFLLGDTFSSSASAMSLNIYSLRLMIENYLEVPMAGLSNYQDGFSLFALLIDSFRAYQFIPMGTDVNFMIKLQVILILILIIWITTLVFALLLLVNGIIYLVNGKEKRERKIYTYTFILVALNLITMLFVGMESGVILLVVFTFPILFLKYFKKLMDKEARTKNRLGTVGKFVVGILFIFVALSFISDSTTIRISEYYNGFERTITSSLVSDIFAFSENSALSDILTPAYTDFITTRGIYSIILLVCSVLFLGLLSTFYAISENDKKPTFIFRQVVGWLMSVIIIVIMVVDALNILAYKNMYLDVVGMVDTLPYSISGLGYSFLLMCLLGMNIMDLISTIRTIKIENNQPMLNE